MKSEEEAGWVNTEPHRPSEALWTWLNALGDLGREQGTFELDFEEVVLAVQSRLCAGGGSR